MTTPHSVEDVVMKFVDKFAGTGEWLVPKSERTKLRDTITTLLAERVEEVVKAERERVREWATEYERRGDRCKCGGVFCDSCRTIHDLTTYLLSDNK